MSGDLLPIERRHRAYGALFVFMTGAYFMWTVGIAFEMVGFQSPTPLVGLIASAFATLLTGYAAYRLSDGFEEVILSIKTVGGRL